LQKYIYTLRVGSTTLVNYIHKPLATLLIKDLFSIKLQKTQIT